MIFMGISKRLVFLLGMMWQAKHGRFVVEQDAELTPRWADWFVNWTRAKLAGTIVWKRVEQGGTFSKLAGSGAIAGWNCQNWIG